MPKNRVVRFLGDFFIKFPSQFFLQIVFISPNQFKYNCIFKARHLKIAQCFLSIHLFSCFLFVLTRGSNSDANMELLAEANCNSYYRDHRSGGKFVVNVSDATATSWQQVLSPISLFSSLFRHFHADWTPGRWHSAYFPSVIYLDLTRRYLIDLFMFQKDCLTLDIGWP